MPAFPHHLCTILHAGGERAAPVVLRSEVERGIPRQRRAAADTLVQVSLQLGFETAQASADFDAWFYGEALAGAAWFDFTNPRTNAVVQARVVGGDLGGLTPLAEAYRVAERSIEIEYVRPGFRTLPPGLHSVTPAQVLQVQRASTATFIDAAGLLQTAAAHVPRFTYFSGKNLYSGPVDLVAGPGVYGSNWFLKDGANNPANLQPGETFTISAEVFQDAASLADGVGRVADLYLWFANSAGTWVGSVFLRSAALAPSRMSATITLPVSAADMHTVGLGVYHMNGNASYLGTVSALRVMVERGAAATAYEPGAQLLVEAEAINCALGTDTDDLAAWPIYLSGTAAVTRQVVADPQFGSVLRLTKTAGALGDRAGVGGNGRLGGMSGTSYVVSCWVKRSADAEGSVYVDANRLTGGLITRQVIIHAAPAGQWARVSGVGSNALGLAGTGSAYVWLDGPIGTTVDIKLPNVTLGTVLSSAFPAGATATTRAADVIQVTA
jgi:hypothetical protein